MRAGALEMVLWVRAIWRYLRGIADAEMTMIPPGHDADTELEACVDRLDTFIDTLQDYAEPTLAFALRIHLAALLQTMVEQRVWTRQDARRFVLELEQEALGVGEE
jgi:hypothetical protein